MIEGVYSGYGAFFMMRKFLRGWVGYSILIALWVSFVPVAVAQVYGSACSADFADQIAGTTTMIDYSAMCETYMECMNEGGNGCILSTLDTTFAECDEEGCDFEILLYLMVVDMFNHPDLAYGMMVEDLPIDRVVEGLELLHSEDYEGARKMFENMSEGYPHPMVSTMIGYLYSLQDESELAIENYDEALAMSLNEPMTYVLRGGEYERLSNPEAVIDVNVFFDLLEQSDAPLLIAEFGEFMGDYEIRSTYDAEDWMWYPVRMTSVTAGGDVVTDLTDEDPSAITLYAIDDNRLLLEGLPVTSEYMLIPTIVTLTSEDGVVYSLDGHFFQEDADMLLSITTTDAERSTGELTMTVFEGQSTTEFILVPAERPDPRK